MTIPRLAADLILVIHVLVVAFAVGGLIAIPLGALARWDWVRNRYLRVLHLGLLVFVSLETLLGISCPLTLWEDALRGVRPERGFVERALGGLIFFDLPLWVFGGAYVCAACLAGVLWRTVPPKGRGRGGAPTPRPLHGCSGSKTRGRGR